MSYIKSKWSPSRDDVGVAWFYFSDMCAVRVEVADENDMKAIERMLDHCTKLGREEAKAEMK